MAELNAEEVYEAVVDPKPNPSDHEAVRPTSPWRKYLFIALMIFWVALVPVLLAIIFIRMEQHDKVAGVQLSLIAAQLGVHISIGSVHVLVLKHDFTVAESSQFKDGNWSDYKEGFGSMNQKIFWLGLESLHRLTSTGKWTLLVRVKWDKSEPWDGSKYVVEADSRAGTFGECEWEDFQVGSEATNYQLGIGDRLRNDTWEGRDPFHSAYSYGLNGMGFTTKDRDNDRAIVSNCASWAGGGWWHNACSNICLTCNRPRSAIWDGTRRLPSLAEMWIKKV